jgi:hypothetical protein
MNTWKFLIAWATISFSGRALLSGLHTCHAVAMDSEHRVQTFKRRGLFRVITNRNVWAVERCREVGGSRHFANEAMAPRKHYRVSTEPQNSLLFRRETKPSRILSPFSAQSKNISTGMLRNFWLLWICWEGRCSSRAMQHYDSRTFILHCWSKGSRFEGPRHEAKILKCPGASWELGSVRVEVSATLKSVLRPPLWSSGQSSWLHNGDV